MRDVSVNARQRAFAVTIDRQELRFPFSYCEPEPTSENPVAEVFVDAELGRQGFTYRLADGGEGSIVSDQVLEYNRDPRWMRDLQLYELTVRALEELERAPLARREVVRRLDTSPSQFYRLIDPTNYAKTIDQMVALLNVLGCEVGFTVRRI